MKRFCLLFLIQSFLLGVWAQVPSGYYDATEGYCGASLKTAFYKIINEHTALSYDALWTAFETTDRRDDGKVWDIYSDMTNYTFGVDQAGGYKKEGDVYNREHSFPKSWFNDARPMYTDLFHLYPSDGYVNGRRSNYPFGETSNPSYTSHGGFSKLGPSSLSGYSGIVFEPADEYKGDLARSYFYMATCYENLIAGWNSPMLAHNAYPAYTAWAIDMLLRWAEDDPVSQKEIDRNNAVYALQHNRNPFIDFPGLEEYIWGDKMAVVFDPDNYGNEGGETSVEAPVFTPSEGAVYKGTIVTVSTVTPDARIVYTLNNGNEISAVSPVTLTVNENTSITAYAELNGVKSRNVTATYTVIDEGGEIPAVTGTWCFEKVTSVAGLQPGSQYLIVCEDKGRAMSSARDDIRTYADVKLAENTIQTEVNASGLPYTLVLGGTEGNYTFYDAVEGAYLSLNSNGNKLYTSAESGSENAQWNIVINSDGTVGLYNKAYPKRSIQYNASAPRFACYESKQQPVTLYRLQSVTLTMNDYGYITYYGNEAFVLPSALKAGIVPAVHAEGQYAEIRWIYPGGSIVPAQTGVIINGASGTYVCSIVSDDDMTAPADNLLKGSVVDAETTGIDCLFYKLVADDSQAAGFYWGADDGTAFVSKAHKAYLAVPHAMATNIRYFNLEQSTDIHDQTVEPLRVDVYSLSGVRLRKDVPADHALDGMPSGIYIVNGQKVAK